jgi:hypothetical protein
VQNKAEREPEVE